MTVKQAVRDIDRSSEVILKAKLLLAGYTSSQTVFVDVRKGMPKTAKTRRMQVAANKFRVGQPGILVLTGIDTTYKPVVYEIPQDYLNALRKSKRRSSRAMYINVYRSSSGVLTVKLPSSFVKIDVLKCEIETLPCVDIGECV